MSTTRLAVLLATVFLVAAPLHAAERPSIVYIIADDLGYGDVQCLNPQRGKIPTPHLDRLASQGMIFTDAHSGSSVCTPTRYGLLTGRYAWRTRLQSGVLGKASEEPLIAAGTLTVPALLREHGYHTAAVGKWHLGFIFGGKIAKKARELSVGVPIGSTITGGPTTRGFDEFFGVEHARSMATIIRNDRVVQEVEPIEVLDLITAEAVACIERRAGDAKAGKPFYLHFALTSPHTPIVPTAAWQGRSGLGDYGDFVMQTDAAVGRVLAALDKHGLAQSTLVIFTSDNGCSPQAGTDRLEKLGHFASERYRGYKSDIWDGGHRVPFFVRWPGRVKAGETSDRLTCLTDLMATVADMLDAKLPESAGVDSVTMLPAMLGESAGPTGRGEREAVVHHSISGRFAIRRGPWKMNFTPGSGGWSKPGDGEARKLGLPERQLYHMADDPGETRNLIGEKPQIAAELTALLERYIAQGRSTPGSSQANDVPVKFAAP